MYLSGGNDGVSNRLWVYMWCQFGCPCPSSQLTFVEHKAGHGTVTSMQQSVQGNVHKFKGEELAWAVVW